jgi:drug/metabolite transporter (DMT)-like permease
MKLGTNSGLPITYANSRLHFNINFYSVAGITLYALSFALYVYLISKFDLGYIIPLATALVYIVIFLASYIVFKESFTATKIAGIALITAGIVLLSLKK